MLICALWGAGCGERAAPIARDEIHFPRGEAARQAGHFETAEREYLLSIESVPLDPRSYFGLVECYAREGRLAAADSLLRSWLRPGQEPRNARIHYALGCAAVRRQDDDAALEEARRAIRADPNFGHAYLLLGSVHYHAGRQREALAAWTKARRLFHSHNDLTYEAWALNMMATVHRELAQLRPALARFSEALEILERLGDRSARQLVLGNLALTRADLGDLAGAMEALEEALALARAVGDRESECWHLTNIAFVLTLAGQPRRAVDHADTAAALARELGHAEDAVTALLMRAMAAIDLGDPARGLRSCLEALPIADSLADDRHRAGIHAILGRAYLRLGRLRSGREAFGLADSLYCRLGTASGSWEARMGLCEIALQEGDTARAVLVASRTLEECARSGYAEGEEFVALFLCDIARAQGRLDEALDLARRALASSRRDGRRAREALALLRHARLLLALGDIEKAGRDAQRAVSIARRIRSPEILGQCEAALADILRKTDPRAALNHYEAALDAIEAVQRNLRLEEFRAAYLAGRRELYYNYAGLLLDLGREAEALGVCERSRARALRDLLAASPTSIELRSSDPAAQRLRRAESHLQTLEATLARMSGDPHPDRSRIRELEERMAEAKRDWEETRQEILLADPRYELASPEPSTPDIDAILERLQPRTALIEYLIGTDGSLVFVARRGSIHAVRLPANLSDLGEGVRDLRRPLEAPRSVTALSFDLRLAAQLRVSLFDPVAPHLEGIERLIIVPDGPLNVLPFEMLVLGGEPTSSPGPLYASYQSILFLADRYIIEYMPSAALLVPRARHHGDTADAAATTLLAMGASQAGPERLASMKRELRALDGLFPAAVLYSGAEATEARFKQLAPRSRWLHLAAHGVADEEVPLYSGVQLAPDPEGREDGFLHAYEILNLRLRCDLATLSACQTALGRLYSGEGIVGLTRAFFYAGADRVVASLWSVDDASTSILMERFYSGLRQGRDAAQALAEAKKALRTMPPTRREDLALSYAHPFFWAPFVLASSAPPPR